MRNLGKLIIGFTLIIGIVASAYTTLKKPMPGNSGILPAQVLDLTNWKLTLPVETEHAGSPDEIKQPELATYKNDNFFFVNKKGDAVVFHANAGGATTSGSNFPRSELREMTNSGKDPASWASSKGTHVMTIDQRVLHLPEKRSEMVIGQIHDAQKYIIFFRLENERLLVSVKDGERITLDDHYKLGTRFKVGFKVNNNHTTCFYNDKAVYTYDGEFNGAYFKAGAYVQSSCKGAKQTPGEQCDAYGEVEIYNMSVKHSIE